MTTTITVTGSAVLNETQVLESLQLLRAHVAPLLTRDTRVLLGGQPGIESLALHWLCRETTAIAMIVTVGKLADQSARIREQLETFLAQANSGASVEVIELEGDPHNEAALLRQHEWMVNNSDMYVAILAGKTSDAPSIAMHTARYAALVRVDGLILHVNNTTGA